MIINTQNLSLLTTGYRASFNTGFRSQAPVYTQLATVIPSTTKTEKYAWLGQFPKLREWIGDRQFKHLAAHNYTIENKTFESSVEVPREDIEDDQYGVYNPLMQEMGYSAATHPDELLFAMLAAATTTTCFDGQYYFDTDHPVGSSTASNYGGGGGNLWMLLDTRRPLKPFIFQKRREYHFEAKVSASDESVFKRNKFEFGVDARANCGFGFWQQGYGSKDTLNATNFDAAVAAMMAFRSDEGRPLGINPNLLVCGPSNRAAAKALLEAQVLASGASNTNYKAVDVLVTPHLT